MPAVAPVTSAERILAERAALLHALLLFEYGSANRALRAAGTIRGEGLYALQARLLRGRICLETERPSLAVTYFRDVDGVELGRRDGAGQGADRLGEEGRGLGDPPLRLAARQQRAAPPRPPLPAGDEQLRDEVGREVARRERPPLRRGAAQQDRAIPVDDRRDRVQREHRDEESRAEHEPVDLDAPGDQVVQIRLALGIVLREELRRREPQEALAPGELFARGDHEERAEAYAREETAGNGVRAHVGGDQSSGPGQHRRERDGEQPHAQVVTQHPCVFRVATAPAPEREERPGLQHARHRHRERHTAHPHPGDPRRVERQGHLARQFCLRLLHRALQIAVPHAEFDGNVALVVFPVDDESAGLGGNRRQLFQRNPGVVRCADQDVPDRVHVLAELRQKADHEVEPPLPLEDPGDGLPTDGGLDHGVHV